MEAVFCDPEVMRYSDTSVRPTYFPAHWIANLIKKSHSGSCRDHWAVVERSTDDVAGYISLVHDPNRCASTETELGFRLARRHWGQGYATEVGAGMLAYCMSTLRWQRIIAIIDPENHGSIRVAEKIGMVFERTIMFDGYDHPDHLYSFSRSTTADPISA